MVLSRGDFESSSSTGSGSSPADEAARAKRRVLEAAKRVEDDAVDPNAETRDKRREAKVAERAQKAAEAQPVTHHSLDTMTGAPQVVAMAKTGVEPDWESNPDHLDTPAEVRADLRDDGLDPMDTGSREEAMFGHFLVHAMADDEDRGGRTPAQLEAEHDMVVASFEDHDVDHDSPLDLADIEGGGSRDPFDAAIDFGFGGEW